MKIGWKIFIGVMIVAWTFIILNFVYMYLNQRIIDNNWDCIAIGYDRMNGMDRKEEHCACLYKSYELGENRFREFWGSLIYNNHVNTSEWLELYNKCSQS